MHKYDYPIKLNASHNTKACSGVGFLVCFGLYFLQGEQDNEMSCFFDIL